VGSVGAMGRYVPVPSACSNTSVGRWLGARDRDTSRIEDGDI